MTQLDRILLKEVYGLNYRQQNKAWKLMKVKNIGIDRAAAMVRNDTQN